MLVKIKENQNFLRDTESKALLNTNKQELKEYYEEREIRLKQMKEKEHLENKVNKLEEDISEIKNILLELVKKT